MARASSDGPFNTPCDVDSSTCLQRSVKQGLTTNAAGATIVNTGTVGVVGPTTYALATYDDFVPVDTSAGVVGITLPPNTGKTRAKIGKSYTVYDAQGNAGANTITITDPGGNIRTSGAAPSGTATIATNYGSATLTYNGPTLGWLLTTGVTTTVAGAVVNNGNSFGVPFVIGSNDAQPVTVRAAAGQNATFTSGSNATTTLGSLTGTAATTVRSGSGALTIDSVSGNIVVGTVTSGQILLGATGAGKIVNLGSPTLTSTTTISGGSVGGQTFIDGGSLGVAITTNNAGPFSVATNTTGNVSIKSGTTGNVVLDSGTTGSVSVGAGAFAKAVTVGNQTGASSLQLAAGSGGVTLTTATAGAVSITTDTTGTILIQSGTTGSVTIDSGTTGAISIGTGAFAKSITIGNTTTTTQVQINAGTAGFGVTTAAGTGITLATNTTGNITMTTGTTGVVVLDSGTTGDVNLGTGTGGIDASAKTIRLGTGAAAKTVIIGSITTTSTTTVLGGTNGVTLSATGAGNVTLNPGLTGNVQLNAVGGTATCGVQLGVPVTVTDKAGGGTIGANTVTVDIASVIEVNQTTGAQTLTVPNPTVTTQARLLYIINIGSVDFTLLASTVKAIGAGSKSMTCLIWSPGATRWVPTVIT